MVGWGEADEKKRQTDRVDYGVIMSYVHAKGTAAINAALFKSYTVTESRELSRGMVLVEYECRIGVTESYRFVMPKAEWEATGSESIEDVLLPSQLSPDDKEVYFRLPADTIAEIRLYASRKEAEDHENEDPDKEDRPIFTVDDARLKSYKGPRNDFHAKIRCALTLHKLFVAEMPPDLLLDVAADVADFTFLLKHGDGCCKMVNFFSQDLVKNSPLRG